MSAVVIKKKLPIFWVLMIKALFLMENLIWRGVFKMSVFFFKWIWLCCTLIFDHGSLGYVTTKADIRVWHGKEGMGF